jgi:hypothetical protein
MPELKPAPRSWARRALRSAAWIAVGVAIAAGVTALWSPIIGPPYIRYHNAHSPGKIPAGDAKLNGALMIAVVTLPAGIVLAVIFRRKQRTRDFFIGFAIFGVFVLVAFALLLLLISKVLGD